MSRKPHPIARNPHDPAHSFRELRDLVLTVDEMEHPDLDLLIAHVVMGYEHEIVKPDWYPYEVHLFRTSPPVDGVRRWVEYTWDEDACNARMFADQNNDPPRSPEKADSLPIWSEGAGLDLLETVLHRHEDLHVVLAGSHHGWKGKTFKQKPSLKGFTGHTMVAESADLSKCICRLLVKHFWSDFVQRIMKARRK